MNCRIAFVGLLTGLTSLLYAGTLSGVTATLSLVDNTFYYTDIHIYNGISQPYVQGTVGSYASWGQAGVLFDEHSGYTGVDVVLQATWTRSSPSDPVPSYIDITYQLGTEADDYASVSGGGCYTENMSNVTIGSTVNRTQTANLSARGTIDNPLALQWTSDYHAYATLTATSDPNVFTLTYLIADVGTITADSKSYGVQDSYNEATGTASGTIRYKTITAVPVP